MKRNGIEMVLVERERAEVLIKLLNKNIPRCSCLSVCNEYRGQIDVLQYLGLLEDYEADQMNKSIKDREYELAMEERVRKLGTKNEND